MARKKAENGKADASTKKKGTNGRLEVESLRHRKDERVNIPTEELRDFVASDEAAPSSVLYPRDPSLDPQLVWKGKDEQDRADLAVPSVPIYVQEKIHPQAIIEAVRSQARKDEPDDSLPGLFDDFNGLDDFDKKIDFYQHAQHWTNRLILGDSLHVMTSLADKEGLKGKVQTIFIDPPYGIRFGSNWQVSTRRRDVKDGKPEDATRQPEQVRAFRDTWELGIHSYLAYLRDRLTAASELLTETGSIFVQIGDENVHLVRSILDEIFGSENFCSLITVSKTGGQTAELLGGVCDYLLWYAKNRDIVKFRRVLIEKGLASDSAGVYRWVQEPSGNTRRLTKDELALPERLPDGCRIFRVDNITSQRPPGDFPVKFQGKTYGPGKGYWKTGEEGMAKLISANRVVVSGNFLAYKRFLDDFLAQEIANLWTDTGTGSFTDPKIYVVQTGTKVIQRCLLMTTDPGDLVLDPTCGSGTTAYVAEQWGRRWITIDTSRVALALARTRLMAAKYPYYLLADSPEGVKREAEITGQAPPDYPTEGDIRKGFVYRRVPHVTLKSIANNPDIREGMTRAEIDAAIARHADTETLYDKPYEDPKRLRVTGPFTVESLSPHRVLSTDPDRPASEADGRASSAPSAGAASYESMILDNLRKAGVQNTKKAERLVFDRLDPYAGTWLHATGAYTDTDGQPRRVAVSLGPEHGTVGPQHVKEAAKEAVQGLGFDLLLVCGFAFDPHVSEETKRYGTLTIQPVRMNPDLSMGDELLKKTGAGNLFMIFGEPDISLDPLPDGRLTVTIHGLDIYDPTTGQIRSSSTDDIACWFLDTSYDAESFFARHAYFTGSDDPYSKLKRALRSEIDEAHWSSLYSTTSYPFDPPKTGKIAVKVINHYGDEVLKVYCL
ncbi:DNA methyltransferase [Tautonia sp. JC769]|uniref:site-specific DNA-methyltransferase n=1 Tax=Tautonia sp. JC769 TaxID=3232135 RepID=UPI00345A4A22